MPSVTSKTPWDQANAPEMLDHGRVRNATEKAWGATIRATDAHCGAGWLCPSRHRR